MELASGDRAILESLLGRDDYDGSLSARAQIVLRRAEGYSTPKIAQIAGTTKPTVRLIQDSAIDLVKPILNCNDQSSIKIAE